MDILGKAKSVRLRSHHDKYLVADEDQETVNQDRNGASRNAVWIVEVAPNADAIRLKSCYGKYLTASNIPFLFGMRGRKVLQTTPDRLNSSVEWELLREGVQVMFKTRYGQFLRANGGVPPWRNQITHDAPHGAPTRDWVLWDVDIVEFARRTEEPRVEPHVEPPAMSGGRVVVHKVRDSKGEEARVESPTRSEGRVIVYKVGDGNGAVEGDERSFTFKGNGVDELRKKLEEETGLKNIVVCSRNPLNGSLNPLKLHLPPYGRSMHVVVVPSSE